MDIAQWPEAISDSLSMHVVPQGLEVVQHTDYQFKGITRGTESAKGKMRKLTRQWFY